MYTEQKQIRVSCKNEQCKYWDINFEQHCSAGDEWDNPYIVNCKDYIPYNQPLDTGTKEPPQGS